MRLTLLAALLATGGIASAQPAAPAPFPTFVGTAQKVEVAPGRALNLVCLGSGPRTVFFDAGGSDWSSIWSTILPAVAKKARACAYDRAGMGYSDAASSARSPFAVSEDLHALIGAAKITGPVVLVGHSLGGFNVKLHTALHPEDVAGLVLLDPSEERTWDRTRGAIVSKYGSRLAARSELLDKTFIDRLVARYAECATAAAGQGLAPGSLQYRRCTDPPRPKLDKAVANDRARIMGTATYQLAQSSEVANSVYGNHASDPIYAHLFRPGLFGQLPMVVLTHAEDPSTDPLDNLGTEQGRTLSRESSRLSRIGKHRIISRSAHYLQFDQPDAVLAAIDEVLAALSKP